MKGGIFTYCNKCGALIINGAKFCTKCGNKVRNVSSGTHEDKLENTNEHVENSNEESLSTVINNSDDNDYHDIDGQSTSSNEDTNSNEDTSSKEDTSSNEDINDKAQDSIDNTLSFKHMADSYEELDNKKEKSNYIDTNVSKNVQGNRPSNQNPKKKSKIPLIIVAVIVVIIAVCTVVFRNNIKCSYYTSKYNKTLDVKAKEEYAEKAFTSISNDSTKKMIKDSLSELGEQDADSAEKKLNDIKDKITMNDYKELACSIKSGKISKLCKDSKYEDALAELEQMAKFGEDIKKDKNYDDIMLNICAKLTGNSVRGSKNLLMEEDNIYYEGLDPNSTFDDIVQVKSGKSLSNSTIKVCLYTYSDGKYKQVDTKTYNKSYDGKIEGVFTCDKVNDEEKKALYMSYEGNTSTGSTYCKGISVLGVSEDKLCLIGNVMGNKDVSCEDFNDDDIYEILSKSTNDSGWFKVFWDGTVPQKIADENGAELSNASNVHQSSQTINLKTSDYIFSYSNTRNLTDYDLKNLDKNTLALARNEIFARHGYVFGTEPFVTYFNNKTWYKANPNFKGDDSELNVYEKANYKKIQEWEAK